MLKLIGSILIVFASAWIGVTPAVRLRRRIGILENLESAMLLMQAELSSQLTPIPDLFKKAALSCTGPCAVLFQNLSMDMLTDPLATPLHLMRVHLPQLCLESREAAIMLEFANALGCYDLESQQRMLDASSVRLHMAAEHSRERLQAEGRSWSALGVCTGLALAIMLV